MFAVRGPSPPPPSPSHTITIPSNASDPKYPSPWSDTMVDFAKNGHRLHGEEIVMPHYPEYDDNPSVSDNYHRHASSPQDGFVFRLQQLRHNNRECLAEFLGTLVLVLLVNGVSASQVLNVADKSWLTMTVGNGMAVMFGISICGHISGAHMNPAITLTLWLFGRFPRRKVPIYCIAQLLGAFLGSAVLYSIISPAISEFDGGVRQILGEKGSAGIFATYPPIYIGTGTAIASEVIGTALLCLLVHATAHPSNQPFNSIQGCIVAAGVMAILTSLGYTSGFALNPARDIGPRIFTALAGWGPDVFYAFDYYALIPTLAPFLGAILGGLLYLIFIDHEPVSNC
ncbi:aquaporin-like protein [Dichotomocladium elegans]|nr:aquaporin-like protein [Dichotomocladium elegans]